MSTITKRGVSQWQAKVRLKGYPTQSKTFLYREDAERWAKARERELEVSGFVDRKEAERQRFSDILKRYQREITPSKKSAAIESIKIDVVLKDSALTGLTMAALGSADIAAWRDRRLKVVSGPTVNREFDVLSTVINHARREWHIHIENPVGLVKRPPKGRARDRRLSDEEERYLFTALAGAPRREDGTFDKSARNPWLLPVVRLALETAMRRGEILSLEWEHIDLKRQTAYLPDTKNGDARTVPLSSKAVAILQALAPKVEDDTCNADREGLPSPLAGRVFPITAMALRKGFARALDRARGTLLLGSRGSRITV